MNDENVSPKFLRRRSLAKELSKERDIGGDAADRIMGLETGAAHSSFRSKAKPEDDSECSSSSAIQVKKEECAAPKLTLAPGEFPEGSVVWAKMATFPDWPAVVRRDEEEGCLLRESKAKRVIHVLFLEDGRTSWVPEKELRPFQGADAFKEIRRAELERAKGGSKAARKAAAKRYVVSDKNLALIQRASELAEKITAIPELSDRLLRLKHSKAEHRVILLSVEEVEQIEAEEAALAEQEFQAQQVNNKRKIRVHGEGEPAKKKIKTEPEIAFFNLVRSGNVCEACADFVESGLRQCRGRCKRRFHKDCFPGDDGELCRLCAEERSACLWCGEAEVTEALLACSVGACTSTAHADCARTRRVADQTPEKLRPDSFKCPRHVCHPCAAHGEDRKQPQAPLIRCVSCPSAFHASEQCVPAGARRLSRRWLLCPAHWSSADAAHPHLNGDTCERCEESGSLVCCERCPSAFHLDCLKELGEEQLPGEGRWECEWCRSGLTQPLFGDVVWAKLGKYRWWPAVVVHPNDVPPKFQETQPLVGEFLVKFFGSGDFAFLHVGRVQSFDEDEPGSRGKRHQGLKRLQDAFDKGLSEASAYLASRREAAAFARESEEFALVNEGPPRFRLTHKNEANRRCFPGASGASAVSAAASEEPCGCAEGAAACADEAKCSNRAMAIECYEGICNAGRSCENRRFAGGVPAELRLLPFHTGGRGWGVRTLTAIAKGAFVCEYVGELIDEAEFAARMETKRQTRDREFYFLSLDKDRIIDAGPKGNIARYMNHSCGPNCVTQTWDVRGERRVGIFAAKDIRPGLELTFHYNFDTLSAEVKLPCFCGAESCLGFLGKITKNKAKPSEPTKPQKKKTIKTDRVISEDFCFHCGVGGDLICCGRPGCPKVYHLGCVNEESMPRGRWDCPWHYCNVCPTPRGAKAACTACPNSFCAAHKEGQLALDSNGNEVCEEHEGVQHYFEEQYGTISAE